MELGDVHLARRGLLAHERLARENDPLVDDLGATRELQALEDDVVSGLGIALIAPVDDGGDSAVPFEGGGAVHEQDGEADGLAFRVGCRPVEDDALLLHAIREALGEFGQIPEAGRNGEHLGHREADSLSSWRAS